MGGGKWYDAPYLPTILKRSGYNVYFWDNQYSNSSQSWDFSLNSYLHNDSIAKMSYTQTSTASSLIDGFIVNDFKAHAKWSPKGHNFILFHLAGQHFTATYHYPHTPEHQVFTTKDIHRNESWMTEEKRKEIAEYDNATRYNDYILGQIFDLFRNTNTVLVYLSDHGEELYDYRDYMGRDAQTTPGVLRYIYEVPFVVWCSDRYRESHPEIVRRITASAARPLYVNDTYNLLLTLAGAKTRFYVPEHDIISPRFKPSLRIVNDAVDYDQMMGRKPQTK